MSTGSIERSRYRRPVPTSDDAFSFPFPFSFSFSFSFVSKNLAKSRACVAGLQLTYTIRSAPILRSARTSSALIPARAGSQMITSGAAPPSKSTFLSFSLFSFVFRAEPNPLPGGSGGSARTARRSSLVKSPTRKVAFAMPFAAAFAVASRTASGTTSQPTTRRALCATLRPSAPAPQNKSRTTFSFSRSSKPHAASTASTRRSACAELVWKNERGERSNVKSRSRMRSVGAP